MQLILCFPQTPKSRKRKEKKVWAKKNHGDKKFWNTRKVSSATSPSNETQRLEGLAIRLLFVVSLSNTIEGSLSICIFPTACGLISCYVWEYCINPFVPHKVQIHSNANRRNFINVLNYGRFIFQTNSLKKIMAMRYSETRGKHQQQRLLPIKQDDWKFWHSNSLLLILLLRILQTRVLVNCWFFLSQTQLKEVSATGFFVSLIHIVVALCGLFGF